MPQIFWIFFENVSLNCVKKEKRIMMGLCSWNSKAQSSVSFFPFLKINVIIWVGFCFLAKEGKRTAQFYVFKYFP